MKKYTFKLVSSILSLCASLLLVVCSTLAWFSVNSTSKTSSLVMTVADSNALIKEIKYYNLTLDDTSSYFTVGNENTTGTLEPYDNGTTTSSTNNSILMEITLKSTSDVKSLTLDTTATQYLGQEAGLFDPYLPGGTSEEVDSNGNCTHEFSLSSIVGFKLCNVTSDNKLVSYSDSTTYITKDTSLDLFVDTSTYKLNDSKQISVMSSASNVEKIYIYVTYSEALVEHIYSINLSNSSGLGAYYGDPIKYVSDFSLTIDGSKTS